MPVPYHPSVTGSQVSRRKPGGGFVGSGGFGGKRRFRSRGSAMSQNIHIRPSWGRGGVPVKMCVVSAGTGVVVVKVLSEERVVRDDGFAKGFMAATSE